MASKSWKSNGYPKTMYTSRTRSKLPSSAPRSNSAMSTRTYSRIKRTTPTKPSGDTEVRRNINLDHDVSSQLDDSMADMAELQNERELLKRMIDQQKQLQELKERQKRVIQLQQQLATMEESAEYSMEEKLDKLKTAKTRLEELQKLVSTIKSVEADSKEGGGDNQTKSMPDKAQQVREALQELDDLKTLIGLVSESNVSSHGSKLKPVATMEPVFPNSIEADEQRAVEYQPVLPEVSVVQYEDVQELSPNFTHQTPSRGKRNVSNDLGRSYMESSLNRGQHPNSSSSTTKKRGKTVRTVSPKKEATDESDRLMEEMRRHQVLLQELRERRQELEDLMNLTRATERDGEEEEERDEDYNDTNASIRSNLGSPDESRGVSDDEGNGNDFETSQSGRLFGLNETDTRRLIDLIRNQKNLGATTEKTTATWGSSGTETSGSDDDADRMPTVGTSERSSNDKRLSKASDMDQINSIVGTRVRDAFTQLDRQQPHEIDFRPPTRRRRNITHLEGQAVKVDPSSHKVSLSELQNDLIASNNTMRILLDDQLSLTKLLLNTLTLQQTAVQSNLCYGISPDFLIYQLDNCSAQFAASLKQVKDWQWQVYSLTKSSGGMDKPVYNASEPLAALHTSPQQGNQERAEYSQMEEQSFNKVVEVPRLSLPRGDSGLQLLTDGAQCSVRDEANGDGGNDLFEALRDSIYSEAAILISQNEGRPHFLIELFHTLQQLNTDYLRQHALYTLQDVMKGYLSSSPRKEMNKAKESPSHTGAVRKKKKKGSYSENTPSESAATSEDEVYAKLKAKVPESSGYDFSLKVSSASDCSTPSEDDTENNPFAAEDLGSTVIHLDAALRHMREVERIKQELQTSANAGEETSTADKADTPQIDTKVLRVWIKNIVSEVIPILKSNHDKVFNQKLAKAMQDKVLEGIRKRLKKQQLLTSIVSDEGGEGSADTEKLTIADFFSGQLKSILDDSFTKFHGKKVGSCGEDLIVALSEILFNELAFFHMMQDLGKEKQGSGKEGGSSVVRIEQLEDVTAMKQGSLETNSEDKSVSQVLQNEEDSEVSSPEDDAAASNVDGKGDCLKDALSAPKDPVTVDLSVSETKPLTSYGSGEDEEEGSGDEYEYKEQDVPTSMQQDCREVLEQAEEQEETEESAAPSHEFTGSTE